jgi:hypothetical protein
MSDNGKIPTGPDTQTASNEHMKLRYLCDEVRVQAFKTQNADYAAMKELQKISGVIMTAEIGPVEEKLAQIMACAGAARSAHLIASGIVRKAGMKLPTPPDYSDYDLPETIAVKTQPPMRR